MKQVLQSGGKSLVQDGMLLRMTTELEMNDVKDRRHRENMKEYKTISKELLQFIEDSPSCFHVVDNIKKMLKKAGYEELCEKESWEIKWGGNYFTVRNDSSIIAFSVPDKQDPKGFHIVAAHSDSPSFKVKENPEMTAEGNAVKLNVEKYGGMIMSTWFDRPLSVAGRIAVFDESAKKVVTRLVNVEQDLLVIPNLAIHMNRDVNKGVEYNAQVDMLPLFAQTENEKGKKPSLTKCLAKTAQVKEDEILGLDLFLYVREKGRILGNDGEFILSPKLDDLQCAFTAAKAFAESRPQEYINVCAVFDNEEVGSGTMQGADSTFLSDVLCRICDVLGGSKTEYLKLLADSFLISADNAHAVHPNHPEKADSTNRPCLNGGIVIKFNGNQKYTTDAFSAAVMKNICKKAGVPYQTFVNRSDMVGGSTLGNISTSHVSIPSVDIGLPQLAMHSAVETAGAKDAEYALKAFRVFFAE